MRRWLRLTMSSAVGIAVGFAAHQVAALPGTALKTKAACAACHANPAGGSELTDAGKAFKADSTKLPPADVKGPQYLGSNMCGACHRAEFAAWKQTKHATAFSALKNGDPKAVAAMATKLKIPITGSPDKTDACVTCHVTGFHLPGGYPAADSASTAAVTNVACEACHGPGGGHIVAPRSEKPNTINGAPSEALCRSCHTAATSPNFKLAEYMKTGVHAVAKE